MLPPYDALLFVSFGGPEGPDDVLPFLRNVTRGRGVPPDRLHEVAEHYLRFGGVSPINEQNRALIAAIESDFAAHGIDLPVYWGNRNWTPYLTESLARMAADGVRRAVVFVTSAYASYSGCRQYRENLADALASLGGGGPRLDKLRHYFNHPGFILPTVRNTLNALDGMPDGTRLAFTTHSIPTAQAQTSGPEGGAYVAQHEEVAGLVAAGVAAARGGEIRWQLVYQSRSGPPSQPWLEPDICDHVRTLHDRGVPGVLMVPIGFVSDHLEVRYDLDSEAMDVAARLGLPARRVPTVGADPDFVAMVRELVMERSAIESGRETARAALGRQGPSHDVCPAGCCPNLRGLRPAVSGFD